MKLSPLAKKMAIFIYIMLFSLLPFRWGSNHTTEIKDSNASTKAELESSNELIQEVSKKKSEGDLETLVSTLRVMQPNDASLPTFIPMVARAALNSNMTLISGTPTKTLAGNQNQIQIENMPSGTSVFSMDVIITGPKQNLQFLLNELVKMPRVISVERFQTQSSGGENQINVVMTLKFYSVRTGS